MITTVYLNDPDRLRFFAHIWYPVMSQTNPDPFTLLALRSAAMLELVPEVRMFGGIPVGWMETEFILNTAARGGAVCFGILLPQGRFGPWLGPMTEDAAREFCEMPTATNMEVAK